MDDPNWYQANVVFPDWDAAERLALDHLVPLLRTAEQDGTTAGWFFIRKRPCWRVRYQAATADDPLKDGLDALAAAQHIGGWTRAVYEPEVHAFGGAASMAAAHRLFHLDSSHLLDYLQHSGHNGRHRREVSVMLCSILMRSAGADWYEQGDVWARVLEHRDAHAADAPDTLHAAVRRLISVDAEGQMSERGPLAQAAGWAGAYSATGRELAALAADGSLYRGIRDVMAHHVIFAWNRLGLPYATQAVLAAAAKTVVFGSDPAQQPGEVTP